MICTQVVVENFLDLKFLKENNTNILMIHSVSDDIHFLFKRVNIPGTYSLHDIIIF